MSIKTVAIVGAGGNLGPSIVNALTPHFTVTAVARDSSTSTFPNEVKVAKITDTYPHAELVKIFKGQDAVVSTVAGQAIADQKKLVDAAVEAGVKRFIPADFGGETRFPGAEENLVFASKNEIREYVQSKEKEGLTWTSLANSAFFDWGMKVGFLRIDLKTKKATVLDSGDAPYPATTLATIGQAVAKILQKPEETKNRVLLIQDFRTSSNKIIAELEKNTGAKWEVEHKDSKEFVEAAKQKISSGSDVMGGIYDTIWAHVVSAQTDDWTKSPDFANDLLGLKTANFEEEIKKLL